MTTRRTILQGAASLIAPADFDLGDPLDLSATESPFGVLIGEYRHMQDQLDGLFAARNRIEADASVRKRKFRNCPELAIVEQHERDWYLSEKKLIQLGARTRAASVDEVMLKLILWRLTDFDAAGFDNPFDMLAFAAYRDLLSLTRQASLTPEADEKSLAIIWNDQAFQYDHEAEDEDDEEYDAEE